MFKPNDKSSGAPGGGKARRQPKSQPTRREMLALRPLRNPALEWREDEGRVVLQITLARNWITRLASVFSHIPQQRSIELDAIGSDVWRLMDGERTFAQIARALADKYKLAPREAELSLQQFFRDLARRGYAAFQKSDG